jgi:Fungal chitosanase of glycosyl hydrolase group 75
MGIETGSVVAVVISRRKFIYGFWGDTQLRRNGVHC